MADVDNVNTRVAGYGLKSTIGELISGLEVYLGREEELKHSVLWQTRQSLLDKFGVSFNSVEEENDFFRSLGVENTIAEILPNEELETKALNSQDLKILLDEYDKYREEKDLRVLAEKAKRNQKLRNTKVSDLVKVLQEKRALELREEKLGNKNPDRASDQKIITESRLVEQGIEPEKAKKLADLIIERDKNETTITKQDIINKTDENNKETIARVLEIAREVPAERKVDELIEKTAVRLVTRVLPKETSLPKRLVVEAKQRIEEMVLEGTFEKEKLVSLSKVVALELRLDPDTVAIATEENIKILGVELENRPETVRSVRQQKVFDEVLGAIKLENPELSEKQLEIARQYSKTVAELPESGIKQFKEQSITQIVGTVDDKGNTIHVTYAGQLFDQFEAATRISRSGQDGIQKLMKVSRLMNDSGINIPIHNDIVRNVDKVRSLLEKDPSLAKVMAAVGKKIDVFNNFYNGLGYKVFTKVGGEKAVGWLATKIGGEAGKTIAVEGLKIIASKGFEAGVRNVFGQLAVNLGLKVSTKLAASGLVKAAGGLLGISNPVGWIITAALLAKDFVGGIFKRGEKALGKIASIFGIDAVRIKAGLEDTLGKFGGGVVFYGGAFVGMLLAIPTMIVGTAFVGPIIVATFGGLMFYQIFIQGPQISSIKPPEGLGGGQCVLKSEADSLGGLINCNQNAPEVSYPGISKAQFVELAGRWKTGKNYAEECYNDVVNRALCAGVNPVYALWVWIHESGASNYSIDNVEDFGIHGQTSAPPKDFNAQINYFLTLDPGAYCLGSPKIGSDYWLGFATNFLNGSCDPDEPNSTSGQTGRQYLEGIRNTWSWISTEGMPNGIKVEAGGESCGNNEQTTYDFVDQQGDTWLCSKDTTNGGGIIPEMGEWDPNAPVAEDCPSMLPAEGSFTQGPFAQGCSHISMSSPAIDLGGDGMPIYATHTGTVQLNADGIYGHYIDIHATCEGKAYFSRYAHMKEDGRVVENGQTVQKGQIIGYSDNEGKSTGPHLHYHITGLESNLFGKYLGLTPERTAEIWGCCGSWNGNSCYN